MDVSVYCKHTKYKKSGLKNMGATCYINTLIQCLSSSNYFINFILSDKYENRLKDNGTKYLIRELKSILNSMCIEGNSLIPIRFLKTLKLKFDYIDINQQNDLHEILLLILNKLNEEIKISNPVKYFNIDILKSNETNNDNNQINKNCYKMWYELHKNEYSELIELFYGQSISQIICGNCNYIYHNYEYFNIIDLELPYNVSDKSVDIKDCLRRHTERILINSNDNDDKWKCDKCNKTYTSEKIIKHWKFPPILIICLKRFNYNKKLNRMTKNNTLVDIPMDLDLTEFALSNDSFLKYKLTGVALHFGNIYGGHYSSLVRKNINNDNEWILIDDLNIQTLKKKNINFNFAYVLFYSI